MTATIAQPSAPVGTVRPYVHWPSTGVDPANVWADYDSVADELLVYFDRPTGSISAAIDTPDRDYVYLLMDSDDVTVVGIHVDDLRSWIAAAHPRWAPLLDAKASTRPDRAAVAALVADAAEVGGA